MNRRHAAALDSRLLEAFRTAQVVGRLDVAEHVLRALECLCDEARPDTPLGLAYLSLRGCPGRRRVGTQE